MTKIIEWVETATGPSKKSSISSKWKEKQICSFQSIVTTWTAEDYHKTNNKEIFSWVSGRIIVPVIALMIWHHQGELQVQKYTSLNWRLISFSQHRFQKARLIGRSTREPLTWALPVRSPFASMRSVLQTSTRVLFPSQWCRCWIQCSACAPRSATRSQYMPARP